MAKRKTEKEVVQVEAVVYEPRTLMFRQAIGTAERDGEKWECALNMNGMTPMVRTPGGRWIVFPWEALCEAANATKSFSK